ncbi:sigma-70 family RNA polymerase sigma factor [Tundrisphaera sp. TA3]|uniref:sigma-70 family RNA polymerase sigma factor n=1 Tax=Tundrisphaera sp. TA3 TaxID=3435775 RepID=UPI003EC150F0
MWPDDAETRGLLDRVADGGGAEAEHRLWERHREPLRRMIGSRLDPALGRRADASDVVQETLIEASRRLADYLREPGLPFHLWLRRIARDRVVDAHRRHRAAGNRSLDRERSLALPAFADRSSIELAAQLRDPAMTPAAAAVRAELARRFREILDGLDDDDREILLLRHFESMTNGEAAKILGLSEPAAGMRHLRALRRLRAALGESPSRSGMGS